MRIATIKPRAIHVDRRDGCSNRSDSCKSAGLSNAGDIPHLKEKPGGTTRQRARLAAHRTFFWVGWMASEAPGRNASGDIDLR